MKRFLTEAHEFLGSWLRELRAEGNHAAVLEVKALTSIASEADASLQNCAQLAHKARVADEEGLRLLERALEDGRLDNNDLPSVRAAIRNFRTSRQADQELMEKLS